MPAYARARPARPPIEASITSFGEQLADEPRTRSAERGAHREFSLALHTPNQKQVRYIRARDQEHQARRNHQQREARLVFFLQALNPRATRRQHDVRFRQVLAAASRL